MAKIGALNKQMPLPQNLERAFDSANRGAQELIDALWESRKGPSREIPIDEFTAIVELVDVATGKLHAATKLAEIYMDPPRRSEGREELSILTLAQARDYAIKFRAAGDGDMAVSNKLLMLGASRSVAQQAIFDTRPRSDNSGHNPENPRCERRARRSELHSIIFPKDEWTPVTARAWLRDHSKKFGKMEVVGSSYHFPQFETERAVIGTIVMKHSPRIMATVQRRSDS